MGVGEQTYSIVLKNQHIREQNGISPLRLRRGFEGLFGGFALSDYFVSRTSLGTIAFGSAGGFTPSFGQSRGWLNLLNNSSKIPLHH